MFVFNLSLLEWVVIGILAGIGWALGWMFRLFICVLGLWQRERVSQKGGLR